MNEKTKRTQLWWWNETMNSDIHIPCPYCGNPNLNITINDKKGRKILTEIGVKLHISASKSTGNSNVSRFIQSSKTIICDACNKECILFCGLIVFGICNDFAFSILNKTHYNPTKYPDIKKFMDNEGILPETMFEKVIAVAGVKIKKMIYYHILFDQFYATLARKTEGEFEIVDISYLEKHIGGGNFIAQ
jgi:hypothetical protein